MRASKPSVACISLMSTPALKPRPSARSTTTRTAASAPSRRSRSASSNQPATVRALTGGWSMTTSAMPASSTVTVVPTDLILHQIVANGVWAAQVPSSGHFAAQTPFRLRVLRADRHDLAGHVGRVVAGQEGDHRGHLPGVGRPAERLAGLQHGQLLVGDGPVEEGVHG